MQVAEHSKLQKLFMNIAPLNGDQLHLQVVLYSWGIVFRNAGDHQKKLLTVQYLKISSTSYSKNSPNKDTLIVFLQLSWLKQQNTESLLFLASRLQAHLARMLNWVTQQTNLTPEAQSAQREMILSQFWITFWQD